jgi:hypothetical protein
MTRERALAGDMGVGLDSGSSARRSLWIGGRQAIVVPCSIEMEQTRDTLHAHVSLEGLDVDYGDEVLIHAAPSHLEFGERLVASSHATVVRASALERMRVRMMSYLQLTELYECGFQPLDEVVLRPVTPVKE